VISTNVSKNISINEIAVIIFRSDEMIEYIPYHHPQVTSQRLAYDYSITKKLFGWKTETTLKLSIRKIRNWIKKR
jgi:nucleoside-diphosphate-sugar epimerase